MKTKLPKGRVKNRPISSQENLVESENILLTGSLANRANSGSTAQPQARSTPIADASLSSSQKSTAPALSRVLNARVLKDKQVAEILFSSDDEERESMKAQRLMYKSYISGQYSSANSSTPTGMLQTDSLSDEDDGSHRSDSRRNNSNSNSNSKRASSMTTDLSSISKSPPAAAVLPTLVDLPNTDNQLISISLQDFSFQPAQVRCTVGDVLVFTLHSSTPLHAEHLLYGDSDTPELCFESPVLTTEGRGRFLFCVRKSGEVRVSCYVYPDMLCHILVAPRTAGSGAGVVGEGDAEYVYGTGGGYEGDRRYGDSPTPVDTAKNDEADDLSSSSSFEDSEREDVQESPWRPLYLPPDSRPPRDFQSDSCASS
eukprot:gene33641-40696_t